LRREENQRTRRTTLGAKARTNNKLNPHMTPGPGIEPGTQIRFSLFSTTIIASFVPWFSGGSTKRKQEMNKRILLKVNN